MTAPRRPIGPAPAAGAASARQRAGALERLGALAPSGERSLGRHTPATLFGVADPQALARELLAKQLGVPTIALHASGRDALRAALATLARRSGRSEVLVPGYTCYSVAAAAVAAGLRVRPLEVTPDGRIDPRALGAAPLERAAALVVCNLFGIAEPLAPLRAVLSQSGVELIDDAAQALHAALPEGSVGARGAPAVLSFGRGKPLCALGGGAIAWPDPGLADETAGPPEPPRPLRALLRLAAHEAALTPLVFRVLSAIPALEIGATHFDPGFRRGALDGASALLLVHALRERVERAAEARRERAEALAAAIRERTAWHPLLAPEPGARAVYPRLALLAPDAGRRDRALAALRALGAGASPLYPAALCDVPGLRPQLADPTASTPIARELAARILTLPTHGGLRGVRLERTLDALADGVPPPC